MRSSVLEKIIEEDVNISGLEGDLPMQNTLYLNTEGKEEIPRDNVRSRFTSYKFKTGSEIYNGSNNQTLNEENIINSKRHSIRGSRVEIVQSQRELKNIKKNSSFFDGKPRTEDDIIKLECPLYRCSSNTIIRSKIPKTFSIKEEENKEAQNPFKRPLEDQTNNNDYKEAENNKKRNAIVDIKLANNMELRTFRSLFMTILQIINCIIRYTIVQFPFCIKWLGLVYGPIIISIIGAMSIFSIYMLIKVKQVTGEKSYSAFAYKWWGMKGKIFILLLNASSSFGSCLSYVIIFLKLIPNLVTIGTGEIFLANKTLLSIILSLWLVVYCYQKDVSGIKAAAYWGVLGIISFLFLDITNMLIWSWYDYIPEDKNMNFISIHIYQYDVYNSIATIILSFSFHTYTFSIYECIENPDSRKMIVTSTIGIFTSTLIYLLVGTIGYILYGNNLSDSILDTMGYSNISVLMSISFVVNVVMSFPIALRSLNHYVVYIIELVLTISREEKKPEESDHNAVVSTDEQELEIDETPDHSGHHHMISLPQYVEYSIMLGLYVGIFYSANAFPNMKTLFGLLGATTANLFSFILPAMFYLKFTEKKLCSVSKILSIIFILVGFFGLVVCLTSNILSVIHGVAH